MDILTNPGAHHWVTSTSWRIDPWQNIEFFFWFHDGIQRSGATPKIE
jgi:hypothetical protein